MSTSSDELESFLAELLPGERLGDRHERVDFLLIFPRPLCLAVAPHVASLYFLLLGGGADSLQGFRFSSALGF